MPNQPQPQPTLTLAQLLSDLVTLRIVSDPASALNLVSARPASASAPTTIATNTEHNDSSENNTGQGESETLKHDREQEDQGQDQGQDQEEEDADLQRAKHLVKLHYEVKMAHSRGAFAERLERARGSVRAVVA